MLHLKKGDKMVRGIKQILQVNYEKIRNKVSMCRTVRGVEGIYMVKSKDLSGNPVVQPDDEASTQLVKEEEQLEERPKPIEGFFAENDEPEP